MIHVKRFCQTILNVVQNDCNIAYLDILLCWPPQREIFKFGSGWILCSILDTEMNDGRTSDNYNKL